MLCSRLPSNIIHNINITHIIYIHIIIIIIIVIRGLPKGRSFTANSGTKAAIHICIYYFESIAIAIEVFTSAVHTQHVLFMYVMANGIRGCMGPMFSGHLSYSWGKTPEKSWTRRTGPTEDRTQVRWMRVYSLTNFRPQRSSTNILYYITFSLYFVSLLQKIMNLNNYISKNSLALLLRRLKIGFMMFKSSFHHDLNLL